jgi:hypothetical protein
MGLFCLTLKPPNKLARLRFRKNRMAPVGEFRIGLAICEAMRIEMPFFARADDARPNQKTLPFTPSGWGNTLLDALAGCVETVPIAFFREPDLDKPLQPKNPWRCNLIAALLDACICSRPRHGFAPPPTVTRP